MSDDDMIYELQDSQENYTSYENSASDQVQDDAMAQTLINSPVLDINDTAIEFPSSAGHDELRGYLKDKVTSTGVIGEDYPVLSFFGYRDDFGGQISSYHRGIDIDMNVGTVLISPDDCIVVYTGYNDIRGYWVVMYWKQGYYIEYQHMSEISVYDGMHVSEGDMIGYSGNTGASLMPHLHLEILKSYDGKDSISDFSDLDIRIDPYYFVFG